MGQRLYSSRHLPQPAGQQRSISVRKRVIVQLIWPEDSIISASNRSWKSVPLCDKKVFTAYLLTCRPQVYESAYRHGRLPWEQCLVVLWLRCACLVIVENKCGHAYNIKSKACIFSVTAFWNRNAFYIEVGIHEIYAFLSRTRFRICILSLPRLWQYSEVNPLNPLP